MGLNISPAIWQSYINADLDCLQIRKYCENYFWILEKDLDIKVSGTYKDYYTLLNKRLQYLHKLVQDFKSKRLALINKDRFFLV